MTEFMQFCDVLITTEEDTERVFGIKGKDYEDVAAQLTRQAFPAAGGGHHPAREPAGVEELLDRHRLPGRPASCETRTYEVEIVDRLGAGDSFAAGLIHGLLDGDLQKGLDYGVATSALKHTHARRLRLDHARRKSRRCSRAAACASAGERRCAMFLTRDQARALDRRAIEEFGVPGVVLMENAGRGAAEVLLPLGVRGPVVVCCGKGNNGGDGFVIARHLDNAGVAVRVLLFARPDELTGDAAINTGSSRGAARPSCCISRSAGRWTRNAAAARAGDGGVDRRRAVRHRAARPGAAAVRPGHCGDQRQRRQGAGGGHSLGPRCDTGEPLGPTVRALHTATFAAAKKGFAQPEAAAWLGQVHVIDIGRTRRAMEEIGAK